MKIKSTLLVVGFLFITSGCTAVENYFSKSSQVVPEVEQKGELPVVTQNNETQQLRSTLKLEPNGVFTAIVENKSDKYLEFILYRINFYDPDGVMVAQIVQYNALAPGNKWKFVGQVPLRSTFKVKTVLVQ